MFYSRFPHPQTIPELCADVCRRYQDQVSLQIKQGAGYRQYTYQQVGHQVDALSKSIMEQGVHVGDRVALVAENRPEWAIAYLGIVAAGATAVPLDPQLSGGELERLLVESRSRLVFVTDQTWLLLKGFSTPPPTVSLDSAHDGHDFALDALIAKGETSAVESPKIAPDDIASLLYTSGTTGKPKGVLLSHRNFVSNAEALIRSGLARSSDNFLAILPLHHAYPFMVAFLVPLWLGARITFLQSLKGPDLVQCLREAQITFFVGVPQIFAMLRRAIFDEIDRRSLVSRTGIQALLALSGAVRRYSGLNLGKTAFASVHHRLGPSLRILSSGGARLDSDVAEDLSRLGFTLLEGYGLTETAPVVTFNPRKRPKIGSVGVAIPGVEVRIGKAETGQIGEVLVRGPNVMPGYDGNPEATAEAIREGWFYTGDLGYLDRNGYLFLTGRTKELIVTSGGKNIYPEDLETQYQSTPAIAELCLVGTERTSEGGEGLHAVVVPNFTYLKARNIVDIRQHLKDELTRIGLTLPPYKRVTGLSIVKEPLPRTRLGKIQRHLVSARFSTGERAPEKRGPLTEADQALLESDVGRAVRAAISSVGIQKPVLPDDYLDLDLGMDSLRRLELVVALEQRLGPLPDTFAQEIVTVRDTIDKLHIVVHGPVEEGLPGQRSWGEILQVEPFRTLIESFRSPPLHHRALIAIARAIVRLLLRTVFNLTVTGAEALPRKGPYILAANHVSYTDPFVVLAALPTALFAKCFTLGWQAYFGGPMTSWIARIAHIIPVGLETPLVMTLQSAAALLRRQQILLIFPEGQRAVDGRLQPFKKGIGVLACELAVPVLPTWITGTFEVLPAGARWPRVHQIALHFGEPIESTGDMVTRWRQAGEDPYEAATRLIRATIFRLKESSLHG